MKHSQHRITVFLDRDGTLNPDLGYIASLKEFSLFLGVGRAMARLTQADICTVLVTNQSGIARGFLSLSDLDVIHRFLQDTIEESGGKIDGIYVCPHHPIDQCLCRKPKIGLLTQAAADLKIDLSRSYMVGDKLTDIELANHCGAVGVLVTTGPRSLEAVKAVQNGEVWVEYIAQNFPAAVEWILQDASSQKWECESS